MNAEFRLTQLIHWRYSACNFTGKHVKNRMGVGDEEENPLKPFSDKKRLKEELARKGAYDGNPITLVILAF